MVSFEDSCVDGRKAFRGLFKFPATKTVPGLPKDSPAVYIVGMIAVPLGSSFLQVNTEALERGTTGAREAAYQILQPKPAALPLTAAENQAGGLEG